jgi:hypothetical protein
MFQSYIWVTKNQCCWEARGLNQQSQLSIADGAYQDETRDLMPFLDKWNPLISALG